MEGNLVYSTIDQGPVLASIWAKNMGPTGHHLEESQVRLEMGRFLLPALLHELGGKGKRKKEKPEIESGDPRARMVPSNVRKQGSSYVGGSGGKIPKRLPFGERRDDE